jgi:hypothetical protein
MQSHGTYTILGIAFFYIRRHGGDLCGEVWLKVFGYNNSLLVFSLFLFFLAFGKV